MNFLNLKVSLLAILGLYSLGALADGGATIVGGGADGCYAPAYRYDCAVGTDVGDGTTWERQLSFTNSSEPVYVKPQLRAGLCANKNFHGAIEVNAWLDLESTHFKGVRATAQVNVPLSQTNLEVLVVLNDGQRNHDEPKYYWMKCVKWKSIN